MRRSWLDWISALCSGVGVSICCIIGVAHQPSVSLQLCMRSLGHTLFQVPTRGYRDYFTFITHTGRLHCFQSCHH